MPLVGAIPLLGEIFTNRAELGQEDRAGRLPETRGVENRRAWRATSPAIRNQLPGKDFFTSEKARHGVFSQPSREPQ